LKTNHGAPPKSLDGERAPWFALEPAAALESAVPFFYGRWDLCRSSWPRIAAMSILISTQPSALSKAFSVKQKRFTAKDAKIAKEIQFDGFCVRSFSALRPSAFLASLRWTRVGRLLSAYVGKRKS
jgi:hypothetical protein